MFMKNIVNISAMMGDINTDKMEKKKNFPHHRDTVYDQIKNTFIIKQEQSKWRFLFGV